MLTIYQTLFTDKGIATLQEKNINLENKLAKNSQDRCDETLLEECGGAYAGYLCR